MLLATGFAFGQSFELIKTKKILVSNMAVGQRYDFKLYNDSLVKTITGGLLSGFKALIANPIWLTIAAIAAVATTLYSKTNYSNSRVYYSHLPNIRH